jgi:FtsZ-binding cell division protein ZapB
LYGVDTYYVRTYTVSMNITLSIDEQTIARAREKLRSVGKSVNEEIREHLRHIAGENRSDDKQWIEELRSLSGKGHSQGWRFNRDEIYERR